MRTLVGAFAAASLLSAAVPMAAPAAGTTHTVEIADMKFVPESLTVKPGDTVLWINKDFFPHNARAADRAFESPDLATNRSWRYVAKKAGTHPYVCTLHPTMKGMLIVE